MSEGREASGPARAPLRRRSRRRWTVVGGVAASWIALEVMTGSAITATVMLVAMAGLGGAGVAGMRAMGITRDHPWVRRMASRPWRDGQDVLRVALRHLSEVFVVTPSGALLAPNVVELHLNPDDLCSLREQIEIDVITASLTEVYEDQVAEHRARFAGPGRAQTYVVADESVPPGRYRLRQGHPVGGAAPDAFGIQYSGDALQYSGDALQYSGDALQYSGDALQYSGDAPELAYAVPYPAHAGSWRPPDVSSTVVDGMTTVMERNLAPVPALRLITGSWVAETVMSGARAGRGPVELVLPDVPTVSREHATFTFSDGRWWVTNQGRNGLTLNGGLVAGEQPLSDGDTIRWGAGADAPLSRVEIG